MLRNRITYSDIPTIGSGQNVRFIIRTGFAYEIFVRMSNLSKPEFTRTRFFATALSSMMIVLMWKVPRIWTLLLVNHFVGLASVEMCAQWCVLEPGLVLSAHEQVAICKPFACEDVNHTRVATQPCVLEALVAPFL